MAMKDFSTLDLLVTGAAPYYSEEYPVKPYDVATVRGPAGMTGTASVMFGPQIIGSDGYPTTDYPIHLDDSGYTTFRLKFDASNVALSNRGEAPASSLTIFPDPKWTSLGSINRQVRFQNWGNDQSNNAPNIRAYGYTSGAPSQYEDSLIFVPCSVYLRVSTRNQKFTKIHANVRNSNPSVVNTSTYINSPGMQDVDVLLTNNEWASFNVFDRSDTDVSVIITVTLPESSDGDFLTIPMHFYATSSWPSS